MNAIDKSSDVLPPVILDNIRSWKSEYRSNLEKKVARQAEMVFETYSPINMEDLGPFSLDKSEAEETLEALIKEGEIQLAVETAETMTDSQALSFIVLQLVLDGEWERAQFFANKMEDPAKKDWYLKYVRDSKYYCNGDIPK